MPDNASHPSDGTRGNGRASAEAFPAGHGEAGPPDNNLPFQITTLVGREKEIPEIKGLLAGRSRLVTLTGLGGSGKTRVALAVAADVVEQYEDGVWLVELAPLSDPQLVPQAVASVLDVREQQGRPLAQTLTEYLVTKKMLLVLDNCEHLIEACADLCGTLLRSCRELRILATSREALDVAGEVAWPTPPLSMPDPRHLPAVESLPQYEAARLFIERAAAVDPTFEPDGENAMAIAQVCYRLDGMPLAIELAAARAKVLSVQQISKRLDESFRLLSGGSREAMAHHRTLEATMEWSHELLSQEEQTLFRRLTVFAGVFSLEAAEAVCAGEDLEKEVILEVLSRLVDKSLVAVAHEQSEQARYRLLETVRQYGAQRLKESGEEELFRRRHAVHYLALAEEAVSDLQGPRQVGWLERLESEHDNLRAALGWAISAGEAELGLGLAAALWPFWYTRGHLSEGRGWLEGAISRSSGPPATPAKAEALNGAGYIALFQGDYDAAKGFLERSLVLYRQLDDKEGIASSLTYLGFVAALGQRDLETIPALYEEAMALREEIEDRRVLANVLLFSGVMAVSQKDWERAVAQHEECLVMFREIGDVQGIGHCLNNLGLAAVIQSDYEKASALLKENLRLARQSEYKLAIQYSFLGLGMVAAALGRPERAGRLWGAEEAMRDAFGIHITPLGRSVTNYEGYLANAKARLDEASWQAAWDEGRAMTPEEAIEYALKPLATPEQEQTIPPTSYPAGLSSREVEVLRLVAKGLTNSQVARELFISPRTVNWHMGSIYRKLGLSSRAEATRFALQHNLI